VYSNGMKQAAASHAGIDVAFDTPDVSNPVTFVGFFLNLLL